MKPGKQKRINRSLQEQLHSCEKLNVPQRRVVALEQLEFKGCETDGESRRHPPAPAEERPQKPASRKADRLTPRFL